MRVWDCGNPYLIFRKLKWGDDTDPVSFLNTRVNIFYAPSQIISLSTLSSHPYSRHLTCSGPTQTHYIKNQASNFILPFSLYLDYISCLTQIFLYHTTNFIFLSNASCTDIILPFSSVVYQ